MKQHVLLLPGLLCDESVWADQRHALNPIANVTIPDYGLRNSIEAMAEHAIAAATDDQFLVAGHSMGGRVALEIVRKVPHRVKGLALLDTGYQARIDGEVGAREAANRLALLDLAETEGMLAMAWKWAPGMIHPDRVSSYVFDAILQMIQRSTPTKFKSQIEALLARPDATSLLPMINCPTLLVCGRQDGWSPVARHEDMLAVIKDAKLRVIEQSGHMSTMEQPEAVNEALIEWIHWSSSVQPPTELQ